MLTMATWGRFESEAPELASVAARLWPGITRLHRGGDVIGGSPVFAVAHLATVRPDGAPRLHPFCPILAGGRLFAAIPRSSPKGRDLRRDGRCVIHALPGPDDDELCIRAVAVEVIDDAATTTMVRDVVSRSGVGGMLETVSNDALFELQLEQVDVARWIEIGRPGTRAIRSRWCAAPPG
jgi:Pyridoxamine 5'-phosphate oxidase